MSAVFSAGRNRTDPGDNRLGPILFLPQLESETCGERGTAYRRAAQRTEAVMDQLHRTSEGLKDNYPVIGSFTFAYENELEQYIQMPPPDESNVSMRDVAQPI